MLSLTVHFTSTDIYSMRFWEGVSAVAGIVATGFSHPVPLSLAAGSSAAQLLREGPRWQSMLSHGSVLLNLAAWVFPQWEVFFRVPAALFVVSGGLACLAFPVPVFQFPYRIGRKVLHLRTPHEDLELMVQVLFPDARATKAVVIPAMPHGQLHAQGVSRYVSIPVFLMTHFAHAKTVLGGSLHVRDFGKKKPLILFSHGLSGCDSMYWMIRGRLAQAGFVVASCTHNDGSANVIAFPDGRTRLYSTPKADGDEPMAFRSKQLEQRAREVSFLLDELERSEFADMIDFNKVVVMGHSFGAATASVAAARDSRIHSLITLDLWYEPMPTALLQNGIQRQIPMLFFTSAKWDWAYESIKHFLGKSSVSTGKPCFLVNVHGTTHHDQTDFPAYISVLSLMSSCLTLSSFLC